MHICVYVCCGYFLYYSAPWSFHLMMRCFGCLLYQISRLPAFILFFKKIICLAAQGLSCGMQDLVPTFSHS